MISGPRFHRIDSGYFVKGDVFRLVGRKGMTHISFYYGSKGLMLLPRPGYGRPVSLGTKLGLVMRIRERDAFLLYRTQPMF